MDAIKITTILSDFSRVILYPKDDAYKGTLNGLHKELGKQDVDYPFFRYFKFDDNILDLFARLKKQYSVNIFTTGSIQNRVEVRKIIDPFFDHIYSAHDYNLDKKDPHSYLFIADKLKTKPNHIIFIDDQKANILAAKKAGLNTVVFCDYTNLLTELKKYIEYD